MLQLPKSVLDLFPMWQCGKCGYYFNGEDLTCPKCGGFRKAPDLLHNYDLMSKYAHTMLMPHVPRWQQRLLSKYFTVFFTSGFESEDNTFTIEWTGFSVTGGGDSIVVEAVHPHSGSKNAKCVVATTGGGAAVCYKTPLTASANGYHRSYYQFADLPPNTTDALDLSYLGDGAAQYHVLSEVNRILTDLRWSLVVVENFAATYFPEATPSNPTTGVWYCIEINRDVTADVQNLWVDSILKSTGNIAITTNSDTIVDGIFGNWSSQTHTCYVDDVAYADARIGCELGGAKRPYFCPVTRHMSRNVRSNVRQYRYG